MANFQCLRLSAKFIVVIYFVSACGLMSAYAQTSWRMSTEYPESSISGMGLVSFAKNVAFRTEGSIHVINLFENAAGIGSAELVAAVQAGKVTGGDAFGGAMEATDPVFGLSSLPFVVQSIEVAKQVNALAKPYYERALGTHGLKLLYVTIWPATGLWSTQALKTSDDLKNLHVRAYDFNSARVFRAAGVPADYMPFNEAIAQVDEHKLNAIVTSGDGGAGRKLWDHLTNFTAINYAIPVSIAFVRQSEYDALPEETRRQVMLAAADTESYTADLLSHRTAENYEKDEGARRYH